MDKVPARDRGLAAHRRKQNASWAEMRDAVIKCNVDSQLNDFSFLPGLLLVIAPSTFSTGYQHSSFTGSTRPRFLYLGPDFSVEFFSQKRPFKAG